MFLSFYVDESKRLRVYALMHTIDIKDIIFLVNDANMANVQVRNIPEDVHRALRVRAALHGRSTEAEIRFILEQATKPTGNVKLGSLLASIAREAGGMTEEEAERFNQLRDKTPAEPMRFE